MRFIKQYASFLILVGIIFLLYILIKNPEYIFAVIFTSIGIVFFALVVVLSQSTVSLFDRFRFILSGFLFTVSGLAFFLFLEQLFFQYAVAALLAIIFFLYIENLYRFAHRTEAYQVSSLKNISAYMHLLTLFFFCVSLFNLQFFFSTPTWLMAIFALIGALLLFWVWMWSQKGLDVMPHWMWVVESVLFTQLLFVIAYLPHIPLVKGIVTTTVAYGMIQIVLLTYKEGAPKRRILRNILLILLVLIITLTTAQWV